MQLAYKGIIKALKNKRYYNELTIGEIKQIRAFGDVLSSDILWGDTMFNDLNKL